jgi:hypothetical protein
MEALKERADRARDPLARQDGSPWPSGFLARSFLFAVDERPVVPSLVDQPMPLGFLAISPDYQCAISGDATAFVALIGHCLDLRDIDESETRIASRLVETAKRAGVDAMLAESDDLAGRYAAICFVNGRWIVFNDAAATRSTYYSEERPLVASHSTIIGDLIGQPARRSLFRHYRYGLPGNASPVAGVRVLPANFELDPKTAKLRRFWPRIARVERPVDELIAPLERLLTRTADAIAARYTAALSLTAGVDSRMSLASFRHIKTTVPFTYLHGRDHEMDVAVARELSSRAGLAHRTVPLVAPSESAAIDAVIGGLADFTHKIELTALYLKEFRGTEFVHVRSNLGEIGRAFWRRHPVMPKRFAASNWADIATHQDRAAEPLRAEAVQYMAKEMAVFFDLAGYDLSDPSNPGLLGYDAWDLVYWEHRMSTWHAQILLGSDYAFDTSIVFNSRRVFELLLSAPVEARKKDALFHMMIARRLPEAADIGINPRSRPRTASGMVLSVYRRLRRRLPVLQALDRRTGLVTRLR